MKSSLEDDLDENFIKYVRSIEDQLIAEIVAKAHKTIEDELHQEAENYFQRKRGCAIL